MRNKTRSVARSMIIAILTALAALIIGTMQSLTTAVTASLGLTAFQAIIVPGTGTPDPYAPDRQNYLPNALNYYVVPGRWRAAGAMPSARLPRQRLRRQVLRHLLADPAARMGRPRRSEVERLCCATA